MRQAAIPVPDRTPNLQGRAELNSSTETSCESWAEEKVSVEGVLHPVRQESDTMGLTPDRPQERMAACTPAT